LELLEKVLREELLVREAVRRGLHQEPEVLASLRATLVQRLIQREFDQNEARKQFSEQDLAAAYAANLSTYKRPELRQASFLSRAATDDRARAAARKELLALKEKLQREEVEHPGAFATQGGGSLGLLARGDLQKQTPELAELVWGLNQVGNIEGPYETPAGLHLLRLEARYQEIDLSLDQVRDQLRGRLWFEQRPRQLEAFYQELRARAAVQVDAAALEQAFKGPSANGRQTPL
jgi:hypothetical protein